MGEWSTAQIYNALASRYANAELTHEEILRNIYNATSTPDGSWGWGVVIFYYIHWFSIFFYYSKVVTKIFMTPPLEF